MALFLSLENWLRDLRLAIRGLRRRPVFAATAIASLGIGIGAVASLFSVVDAVVWKPVALPDSHQLVFIDESKRGAPMEQRTAPPGLAVTVQLCRRHRAVW